MFELFLLVKKYAINGQQHAQRGDAQNIGAKKPKYIMANLGFERFRPVHVNLVAAVAQTV